MELPGGERSFGVNSTGHFLVAREGMRLFKAQGLGGAFVFVATKNVMATGKDFGAYSASKPAAAQPILPEDEAEAALFLASDRSVKTTGCTLTVDGGVKDAFPR